MQTSTYDLQDEIVVQRWAAEAAQKKPWRPELWELFSDLLLTFPFTWGTSKSRTGRATCRVFLMPSSQCKPCTKFATSATSHGCTPKRPRCFGRREYSSSATLSQPQNSLKRNASSARRDGNRSMPCFGLGLSKSYVTVLNTSTTSSPRERVDSALAGRSPCRGPVLFVGFAL